MRKAKPSEHLAQASTRLPKVSPEAVDWGLWLLLLVMVTVFGIAARGISHGSPRINNDPYGVGAHQNQDETRSRVETGL